MSRWLTPAMLARCFVGLLIAVLTATTPTLVLGTAQGVEVPAPAGVWLQSASEAAR